MKITGTAVRGGEFSCFMLECFGVLEVSTQCSAEVVFPNKPLPGRATRLLRTTRCDRMNAVPMLTLNHCKTGHCESISAS